MVRHINDHEPDAVVPALSSEQFDELKALLQPGYELSSLMLADYKERQAQTEALQAKEVAAAKEIAAASETPEQKAAREALIIDEPSFGIKALGDSSVAIASDVDGKPVLDAGAHD